LALEDEDLLPKSQDLTVSIVGCQATYHCSKGREEQEHELPEHDPRIVPQPNRVKGKKA
jgi:hypothetical protein